MLDRHILPLLKKPFQVIAGRLVVAHISANTVTLTGFFMGMVAIGCLVLQWYIGALVLILINRIFDGIDGEVARLVKSTDDGAYLDIVLDFIFYAGVVTGFALGNPVANGAPAALLLFGFMGTASSFLAFAIMAERRKISSLHYPSKGFYYLGGLTEATETIVFFVLCCLLPDYFPVLARVFFCMCFVTTVTRISFATRSLR